MPNVKEAIYAALSTDSEVGQVVGSKIYPDQVSDTATFPFMAFQVVSDVQPKSLRGTIGIRFVRFQLTAWASTRAEMTRLREALEKIFDGKAQASIGGLLVKSSMIADDGAADEDEAADDSLSSGPRSLRMDVNWRF